MARFFAALVALLLLASEGWAEKLPSPLVHSELLSDKASLAPGNSFQLGVLLSPTPGWHIYWENPGDAGIPTTLDWTLPDGFSASAIDWPLPTLIREGDLAIYGYTSPTFLPVTLTAPQMLSSDSHFQVKANWLVCKDICIPESATMELTLAKGDGAFSDAASFFADHEKAQPTLVSGHYEIMDKTIVISVSRSVLGISDIKDALFFPRQQNIVTYAADQKIASSDGYFTLTLERGEGMPEGDISGLLTVTSADGAEHHFDLTTTPLSISPTQGRTGFVAALFLAIVGGLILNLMPCVLPILSLKALAIAKKAHGVRAQVMRQGVAYTFGVLATFALLAGALLALRSQSESIGWGYQMQSPAFVGFLIYLLFLVGLSLSDILHLPVLLGNVGINPSDETSTKGSFLTGALAVAVATPCTAPFMASAVGAALTLPTWQAMLIFEALGFGLALPFLLISLFPRCLRFLPKPGRWMEIFKQALAFPMYASAIWLLWVLSMQTGANGIALALTVMLIILVLLWMRPFFKNAKLYRSLSLLLFVLLCSLSLNAFSHMQSTAVVPSMPDMESIPFSREKLEQLRSAGTPVFIDVTAAWCITCQVNARTSIRTSASRAAFKKHGVILMIADWTRKNPDIGEFLQSFGYSGVPLYVYYPSHGEPIVLPQLLTPNKVIETVGGE